MFYYRVQIKKMLILVKERVQGVIPTTTHLSDKGKKYQSATSIISLPQQMGNRSLCRSGGAT